MSHEFFVIVEIETGKFMKKYQWTGYKINDPDMATPFRTSKKAFTDKIGRARIFESYKVAVSAIPNWTEGGNWLDNGLVKIVRMVCSEE